MSGYLYPLGDSLVVNRPKYETLSGPAFMAVVNKVSRLLTEPAIRSMNKAVRIDKENPADVARAFLKANALAGGSGSQPAGHHRGTEGATCTRARGPRPPPLGGAEW